MSQRGAAPLRVLHVPYTYYPDPVGGTEVYVGALARELRECGIGSTIAAPAAEAAAYEHNDVEVHRFETASTLDLRSLYGEGDAVAARGFARVLDAVAPHIVHLHALTAGSSVLVVREAKRRGLPVVFTYHTPTVSCPRGTLLRTDASICDGELRVRRCTACVLASRGIPEAAAALVAAAGPRVGIALGWLGAAGGMWTALRMAELVELRHAAYRELMSVADEIIAPCAWVSELLARQGINPTKVTLSRQGLAASRASNAQKRQTMSSSAADGALRVAFLGRLDRTKGVDVVVRAMRSSPELPVELHLYGLVGSAEADAFLQELRAIAGPDERIRFLPPVRSADAVITLAGFDALVVPSVGMETGPLVVLEAFAAGIPVIGSRLGGISELVRDGVDGVLVDPWSERAWQSALAGIASDRTSLVRLRAGVRYPRTMADAATDMARVYARVSRIEHVTGRQSLIRGVAHASP